MRRADGQDERWNTYGTAPGRSAVQPKARKSKAEMARDVEESDPLVRSLLQKYGAPRDREDV